jgi:hypothetical protein
MANHDAFAFGFGTRVGYLGTVGHAGGTHAQRWSRTQNESVAGFHVIESQALPVQDIPPSGRPYSAMLYPTLLAILRFPGTPTVRARM